MASKKETEVTEKKSVKPITLRDQTNGDIYVLEFSRDSVRFAEARGFKIAAMDDGAVMTTTEDLFFYAFRMHQPKISKAETDKILYEKLKGMPKGMMERLVDLYLAPVYTLSQNEEDEKNATMTAEF